MNFAVVAGHKVKIKENKNRDQYLHFAKELKKNLWGKKVTVIPIIIGGRGTISKSLLKGLNCWKSGIHRDHPNYCIVRIGQNSEESPEDLRRLAVP